MRRHWLQRWLTLISLILMGFGLSGCVHMTSFTQTLINLGDELPAVAKFISALAYMGGLFLMLRGVFALKAYGEARTMMSHNAHLKPALVYLLVGMALVYSPQTVSIVVQSVYGNGNILSYQDIAGPNYMVYLVGFIQVVGFISFIRGWFMLSGTAHQAQHGTFGKAMTHIVGGMMAMNFVQTANMLANSLGLTINW